MVEVKKEDIERVENQIYDIRKEIAKRHGEDSVGERDSVHVIGRDLDDLYFQSVMAALKHGELNPVEEGSHAGSIRLEFPAYLGTIKDTRTRPIAPSTREGIPVSTDDNAIQKYFENYLLDGALHPNEHYRYSSWIVGMPKVHTKKKIKELGLDIEKNEHKISLVHEAIPRGTRLNQLEWCVEHFTKKGFGTNHCAITVGCPKGLQRYDWPYDPETSETDRGTSECLRGILLKIRKGNQLDLSLVFRSWDLYNGFPENIGGFIHLMDYTANLINATKKDSQPEVIPGRLQAFSDGLHIYSHSIDLAKMWTNIK